jgi:hypothetical protein
MRILTAIFALAVLLAPGCASTPQASRDRDAEAKQFQTHPGASAIYVYRSKFDQLEEEAVLYLDSRLVGQTLPGAYFRVDPPPGKHTLQGVAADQGRLTLETRAGELYFVELSVSGGQSHFRVVPEEIGRKRVRECCVLLESWSPGPRPLLK